MTDLFEFGSAPHRAFVCLRAKGGELTITALADAIGGDRSMLAKQLSPGLKAGIFNRRVEGASTFWSLGDTSENPLASKTAANAGERPTIVQVGMEATPSIFAYAKSRGAAPFTASISTDGRMSIERYGRVVLELTNAERQIVLEVAANGVTP